MYYFCPKNQRIMNKRIAIFLTLAMVVLCANAVPVRKGNWKKIQLADGSVVDVQLKGDEALHYWESADGIRYVENPNDQTFEVADAQLLQKKVRIRRSHQLTNIPHRAPAKSRKTIYQGKRKGLVILVEFNNKSFLTGHDAPFFTRIMNEIGYSERPFKGSVKDYFLAQSGGMFELDFDVVGPVKVSNASKYYAGNDGTENVTELVREACLLAEDLVNFADYDWDGDGEVEQIYVLYAGKGQHDGGGSSTIWPHEWSMSESWKSKVRVDNVWVDTYSCGCELSGDNLVEGIGLMCHEYSHCMGIMDMYDTNDEGNFGMNNWDIMDYGCYNDDGYQPSGYTSYEKWVCGWLEPIELTSDTTISEMKALSENGEAYIIYNDNNKDEYYLLENRQKTGWDASLDGSGLLILHVDYDELIWMNNAINTLGSFRMSDGYSTNFKNNHQRLTIFHADNREGTNISSLAGDPYPYNNNNSLTNSSTPAATLYNANTDGSYFMNKDVKNIVRNGNGTISFDFALSSSDIEEDTIPSGDYWFYESFNQCNGTGGNDGRFSGSIASSTFLPDHDGWVSSKKYGGDQCAKFGNASTNGMVNSPEFLLNGEATLMFKAAAFGTDGNSLDVYLGEELIDATMMSNTQWTTYTYTITGDGKTYLRFVPDKRFFLDEVCVIKKIDDGIVEIQSDKQSLDPRIFGLDGKCYGTDWQLLPKGIYIYNGKKRMKL